MEHLKPYLEVERTGCPFYGFYKDNGALSESESEDNCGLIIYSFHSCMMQEKGKNPDWPTCSLNNKDRKGLEETTRKIQIFPREFRPPKEKLWEGMPLFKWMDYILNKK